MERVAAEQTAPPHDATVTRRVAAQVAEVQAALERDRALHRPGRLHACSLSRSARTRSSSSSTIPWCPGHWKVCASSSWGCGWRGRERAASSPIGAPTWSRSSRATGDPARQFGAMLGGDLPFNPPFELDNRGKRSIVVDLAVPAGHAIAMRARRRRRRVRHQRPARGPCASCVSTMSTSPRATRRLVYAAITGYGEAGPERDRAAYDIGAFWARAGIAHMLTPPGGTPPFQRGGMGDHSVAMTAAGAVCAALVSRESTGRGPGGVDLVAAPGRLHGRLRPQHRAALRRADRHRDPHDDEESGRQLLSGPRRAVVLAARARG